MINALAWSPDNRMLASGGNDDGTVLWECQTWKIVKRFEGVRISSARGLSWRPDGKALLAWCHTDEVVLLDPATGQVSPPLVHGGNAWGGGMAVWSPDGKRIAAASGAGVEVLSGTDRQRSQMPRDMVFVRSLPDIRHLVAGSETDPTIWTYDAGSRQPLGTMIPYLSDDQCVVIGPDGHYRGSWRIDEHLVYVALTDDGRQETYTPADFSKRYGWKNDPKKAILLGDSPKDAAESKPAAKPGAETEPQPKSKPTGKKSP
jgi:Tol biopolymer transport system component